MKKLKLKSNRFDDVIEASQPDWYKKIKKVSSVPKTGSIVPKSKGDCSRLLIQTAPPLDHKYGYFPETALKWAALWDIDPMKFWEVFGVNTVAFADGKTIYYPCDVERTIRECVNKTWVHPYEWD